MKTEQEVLKQRRTLNRWISNLDPEKDRETISLLCGYYDVLSWVLLDKGRWVEDFGLSHVLEVMK